MDVKPCLSGSITHTLSTTLGTPRLAKLLSPQASASLALCLIWPFNSPLEPELILNLFQYN